jgi:hypothetical protein
MKSVGEVMAIGRTWQESLQKALRGMEAGLDGWSLPKGYTRLPKDQLMFKLRVPNPDRMIIMKQVGLPCVWRGGGGKGLRACVCVCVWLACLGVLRVCCGCVAGSLAW